MPATIKCDEKLKESIRSYIEENIEEALDEIGLSIDDEEFSIDENKEGLVINFPIEEVYGGAYTYCELIVELFENLKNEYKTVGIEGLVYEEDTTCYCVEGFYFYCKPEDKTLKSTDDWQICECCKKTIVGNTYYNSPSRDNEEGNRSCLCSPLCMLEYVCDPNLLVVEPNGSFSEDDVAEVYDSDEPEVATKEYLWKRTMKNFKRNSKYYLADKKESIRS